MPIYEYECESCGQVLESIVSFSITEITCDCGGTAKKIVSKSNFTLKGKGWAKDGYSKDNSKKNK
jgi:putative FmdB family regulatory protein